MARHRAPRRAAAVVPGLAAAAIVLGLLAAVTGLVLLLAPAGPLTARAGSVLDPAGAAPATTAAPGGGEAAPAPVTVGASVPPVPEPPRALPLPVLQGFSPDRLVVAALGVDAPLRTTLVDGSGALVPPRDPDELGWWRGVRPGTGAGSVVVAGHVDSTRFGQGPLARLVDLEPGDRAVVSGPDGARAEYVVRGVETFPKESLPAADLFRTDGAERLVLVTCGGTFDRAEGSWDSNIVAVLDRVPPA